MLLKLVCLHEIEEVIRTKENKIEKNKMCSGPYGINVESIQTIRYYLNLYYYFSSVLDGQELKSQKAGLQ